MLAEESTAGAWRGLRPNHARGRAGKRRTGLACVSLMLCFRVGFRPWCQGAKVGLFPRSAPRGASWFVNE